MTEQIKNFAQAALAADVTTTTQTTFTLDSAASFPSSGDFRIRINNELILITGVAGDVLSCGSAGNRGIEGTVPSTHSSTDDVYGPLTKTGLENIIDQRTGGSVATHIADTTDAHVASSIGFTPTGTIAGTTVQAAVAEVSGDVTAGYGLPVGGAGLTGAVAATRFVGGVATTAPSGGTFAVGDFVVSQANHLYVCTVAGTPGTWRDVTEFSDIWLPFTIPGTVAVAVNAFKIPPPVMVGNTATVFAMRLSLGTVSASGSVVATLLRDGTTNMFSSSPGINAGNNLSSTTGTPGGSAGLTSSNWMQVSVTSAGTSAANLSGVIGIRRL